MAERAVANTKAPEAKQTIPNSCMQNPIFNFTGSPVDRILQLQRTAGNQAVQRLIKSRALQAKLRIGQPNDIYEQEADRVTEQVLRMPDPALQRKKCNKCDEDEKKVLQAKELPGQVPVTQGQDVYPIIHEELHSPGQALDLATRTYMEPRFGHDFSSVRVYTDEKAAELARSVNARAFTVGKNVVFGGGQYAPQTSEGKRLLAHELMHVVQQEMIPGYYSRFKSRPHLKTHQPMIQCDKIPYQQLTWADFKGKVPKNATFSASTYSAFHDPVIDAPNPKSLIAEDTEEPCKIGKKDSTKFEVNIKIDPAKIKVKPYMWQEQSWAMSWTTEPKAQEDKCKKGIVSDCEKSFDKMLKDIGIERRKSVMECKKAFDKGAESFEQNVGDKRAEANTKTECDSTFAQQFEEFSKEQIKFTVEGGKTASTKKECETIILMECKELVQKASNDLLKHEQGHFDISNVKSQKTQDAMRALAGTFDEDITICGKNNALVSAKQNLQENIGQLRKEYIIRVKELNDSQKNYDDETHHGLKLEAQKEWEKKIEKGLP